MGALILCKNIGWNVEKSVILQGFLSGSLPRGKQQNVISKEKERWKKILMLLSEHYHIELTAVDATPKNFQSPKTLAALVKRKQNES